jgi:tetratricopeptide (TPR) repeat protein
VGVAGAAGWAFFIPAQAYSVILMPTAWLIFVFWFLVWQVVRTDAAPGMIRSLLFGLLIGVTAMGIATILFIVPLLIGAIILNSSNSARPESSQRIKAKLVAIVLLFLGLGAGTSPCWLHNIFIAHDRVTLSAHSGINFWIGNNPIANGYPRFPPGLRAGQAAMLQDSIAVAETEAGRPLKRSEVSAYWSAKAKRFISENPGAWLRLVGRKVANFWNAFQYDDLSIITNLREQGVILPGLRFGLVAALALPGMLLAAASYRRSRWIIAAVLLHMTSLLSVFVTERYRLAAVPGLLLFAAFGVWQTWQNCSLGKYRPVAVYLAFLAAATLFVSQPQRDSSLWALDAYNSGWQALESQNWPLAKKKLELAQAYVPDNAEINLALGNLWLERNDPLKAEGFYRATLAIEPRHKSALSNLGVLVLQTNRSLEAVNLFRTALKVQRDDAKTHYLLARALLQTGEKAEALSEAETAARLKPDQPEFAALRNSIVGQP